MRNIPHSKFNFPNFLFCSAFLYYYFLLLAFPLFLIPFGMSHSAHRRHISWAGGIGLLRVVHFSICQCYFACVQYSEHRRVKKNELQLINGVEIYTFWINGKVNLVSAAIYFGFFSRQAGNVCFLSISLLLSLYSFAIVVGSPSPLL